MYFIVLWFLLFEIFMCINFKLNRYTKQKKDKVTDLLAKMKNLTFRVDLWSQKVMWLRNGRSDFRKVGVNYPQDFKEKSHEAAWLKAWRFCVCCKIRLGGPPRPPGGPS